MPPADIGGGNLWPCRRHSRPFGAAGAGGFECPRGRQGPGAGRTGPQGAGPRQAGERATRDAEQRVVVCRRESATKRASRRSTLRSTRCAPTRLKARQEIGQRFPAYADLVAPKPPSVEQIKATLTDGEAMLSFYFGQTSSFVWAVPKDGPVAFAAIKASSGDIESKVRKLREALEPQAAMISDIPPFDLKLAHELYTLLLKPVESGWKPAKNLIVVTNGALGLLPLSLLPTAPAEIGSDDEPLFAGYKKRAVAGADACGHDGAVGRGVAHACASCRPASPTASELIAFGDPYFSKEQEAEAAAARRSGSPMPAATTTRGGAAEAAHQPEARRRGQRRAGAVAAASGYRRMNCGRSRWRCEADPSKVLQPWQAGQRTGGQDDGPLTDSRFWRSRPMVSCPAS